MVPSLKRSLSATAVVVAALVAATAANAAAGDPKKRLNAVDQAYAKSILLRKADLPTGRWQVDSTNFDQANPACLVKHYSLSALTATGEAGFIYKHGGRVIESDARVFLSSAQAARAFAILSSVGLGRCLGSSLAAVISATSPGLSAKLSSVQPLAFTGLAATARGLRIGLRLRGSTDIRSIQYVLMSVRRGRALATIGLIRYNADWPSSVVRPLAALTATRMTKR